MPTALRYRVSGVAASARVQGLETECTILMQTSQALREHFVVALLGVEGCFFFRTGTRRFRV